MKLPSSVGQKKIKALEQMLLELGVGEYGAWAHSCTYLRQWMRAGEVGGGEAIPSITLWLRPCLPPTHL